MLYRKKNPKRRLLLIFKLNIGSVLFSRLIMVLRISSVEASSLKMYPVSVENEPERNSLLHRILVSDELIPAESITVWIDPLDATKEYTEGLKQYVTTMVGIGSFYS